MARDSRLLVVLGTRPEAIKLAPVIRRLRGSPSAQTRVCLTGQHRDMVATILSFFDPEVRLLELGVNDNSMETWKLYGPDSSGTYGGMQGIAGLDAVYHRSELRPITGF